MYYRRSFFPGGTFFFTVTLADRRSDLLVRYVDALRLAFQTVRARHPFDVTAIVVMPDHLHTIWQLPDGDDNYAQRWALIKSAFSRSIPSRESVSPSRRIKRERGIWQRRCWEHQIRDEQDFARHVDYIHFNPVKHGHASRVVDWPYSSFHRYVREGLLSVDWGGER
ncbi:REP-associated tyrosine transposase [Uliginosibacterium sp. H1]|uniref:REP-associated tyrosine transposase n=1 Tax=Uliginosibacterium sp. H1 TaxID=3114757 RepID=UPI002E1945A6|nr:transposase [Uliginosibacterium sp. H1]